MSDRQTTAFLFVAIIAFLLWLNNSRSSSNTKYSKLQSVLAEIRGLSLAGNTGAGTPGTPGGIGVAPILIDPRGLEMLRKFRQQQQGSGQGGQIYPLPPMSFEYLPSDEVPA